MNVIELNRALTPTLVGRYGSGARNAPAPGSERTYAPDRLHLLPRQTSCSVVAIACWSAEKSKLPSAIHTSAWTTSTSTIRTLRPKNHGTQAGPTSPFIVAFFQIDTRLSSRQTSLHVA